MAKSDFLIALTQLAAERNLPREIVMSAIEAALASAYRRDATSAGQNISVKLDPGSGEVTVSVLKTVADEVLDHETEVALADARALRPNAQVGDVIVTEELPHSAGRIAAQTAKQVVTQRLREAERDLVYQEYIDKVGEVFPVTVQRVEASGLVVVDMARGEAVLPHSEQMPTERYRQGQKIKVLLKSVERTSRGTEIRVSRADGDLLRRLFEMEVPEIYNGAVEMVSVAREAGSRSKVAVRARQDGVDPVGSCVGLRGVRIQNIVNELQGEKIDVLEWHRDTSRFIANGLNPANVVRVDLDPYTQTAIAVVPDRQLSLAIGKEGQNARLAAKLTGWSVDIKNPMEADEIRRERELAAQAAAKLAALRAAETDPAEMPYEEEEDQPDAPTVVERAVADITESAEAAEAVIQLPTEEEETETSSLPSEETRSQEQIEAEEAELMAELEREERERAEREAAEEADIRAALEAEEAESAANAEDPADVEVTSLRDLPEDVWSIPTGEEDTGPSGIRFAEDIAGLRGGVTVRRSRRAGGPNAPAAAPPAAGARGRRRGRPSRRRR